MAIASARYGVGVYGNSKYGILAVLEIKAASSMTLVSKVANRSKLLATSATLLSADTYARVHNFPYRKTG